MIKLDKLEESFKRRNINVLYFETFTETKDYLMKHIPESVNIGIGHSQTIQHMDITNCFKERRHIVFNKEL